MSMVNYNKVRLGDLLIEQGLITPADLDKGLKTQSEFGGKLGRVLIDLGLISEESLLLALANQFQVPLINFDEYPLNSDIIKKLPEAMARRFRAIPISDLGASYLVVFADPTDLIAKDEIGKRLGASISIGVAKESDILIAIDQTYRKTDAIVSLAEQLEFQLGQVKDVDMEADDETDGNIQAPVTKLLSSLFEDAIQVNASDVHIEPDKNYFRIRLRVDGVLQEQIVNEKAVLAAVVSRLKLMAKLNISEKRLPQDGRFTINVLDKIIDVRVSTLPVSFGESVVMRLLDRSKVVFDMSSLGMPPLVKKTMLHHIHAPHGMILVTGPTGSGKSTTLYSCLQALNTDSKKIITAEDPVEFSISRINQVQSSHKIGLTFAKILRAALRQDPDVVMVGEIRDEETATIALQASLTGHMVFSTLHTNDAIGCAERLINMGAEPFLVAASLKLVVAQRLVRRLCLNCVEDYTPNDYEMRWIGEALGVELPRINFKHSVGCPRCSNTGYKGRVAVYEFLEIDEKMAYFLRKEDLAGFAKYAAQSKTYRPLSLWALDFATQGITSLAEVLRVSGGDFDDEV